MKILFEKKEKASALVVSMIILGIVLASALSLSLISLREQKSSILSSHSGVTFQSADKGVEIVMNEISKGGYYTVSQILPSKCDSSTKEIEDANDGYRVTLLDKGKNKINCDSTTPVPDIYYLHSIGTQPNQSQRAVEAPVFSACVSGSGDSKTTLLLHMDQDNPFLDSSAQNHSISKNGDVAASSTEVKFCRSAYFDGNGDYLSISDSDDWNFGSGDFTIDGWVNFSSLNDNPFILSQINSSGLEQALQFYYNTSDSCLRAVVSSSDVLTYSQVDYCFSPSIGTWYHVALERSGSDLLLFVNGVQRDSKSISFDYFNSSASLTPGLGYFSSQTTPYYFNGYIDELRVSKGVARWTADFTPPSFY